MNLNYCKICKNKELLNNVTLMYKNSLEVCDCCYENIFKFDNDNVHKLVNSLAITYTWIDDYKDSPKIVYSCNERVRKLKEELMIIFYVKNEKIIKKIDL